MGDQNRMPTGLHDIADLTYLSWSLSRSSTGTAASFLKSYEVIDNRKFYYKMSNHDTIRGVIGHESINEIVHEKI